MTFKEAMEHYRAGTATEAERQMVEQELEKTRLINEYLEAEWDDAIPVQAAAADEMKQVRKNLIKRNAVVVLTSVVLVMALALGIVYVGIPAAERLYWNPAHSSFAEEYSDLELTLAAHAELFCPEINISGVSASRIGFASHELSIRYWDNHRGGDVMYASGNLEMGELSLPEGLLRQCAVNIFDRATYPLYEMTSERKKETFDKLARLPSYVTVVAAVSFPEDKSLEEVLAFEDSLITGSVGWVGIRTGSTEEQMLPLCGMNLNQWGTVRDGANGDYPCLDTKGMEKTPEHLQAHFESLLRFSADQVENGTGIPVTYRDDRCYYTDALEYVEENGIYSYGCYVVCTSGALLLMLDLEEVTQVWIQDIWITP